MKKKPLDTNSLTRKYLKEKGYIFEKVEYFNSFCHRKFDPFGFDYLGVLDKKIIGIQSTTFAHSKERVDKLLGLDTTKPWLMADGLILVLGWIVYEKEKFAKEIWLDRTLYNDKNKID